MLHGGWSRTLKCRWKKVSDSGEDDDIHSVPLALSFLSTERDRVVYWPSRRLERLRGEIAVAFMWLPSIHQGHCSRKFVSVPARRG